MSLRPINDWAVIKISASEERTPGGIIIPDTAKDKPSEGIITAIGPGRYKTEEEKGKKKEKEFVPTILKPGQKVVFLKYSATELELDGEQITLVREEDILGTVEEGGGMEVRKPLEMEVKP